jgi:hypothetical protein
MLKKILAFFKKIYTLLFVRYIKTISDPSLEKRYLKAGGQFGDAVSYIWMGECIGFEDLLNTWAVIEQEYASRGFRTISIDDFVGYGGWGHDVSNLIGKPRKTNEPPVLHAELYRVMYLGKMQRNSAVIEAFETGNAAHGTYLIPSTKNLTK